MQPIRTFNVSPSLPPQLEPLRKLAYNLHWDWSVETKDLFGRLDADLWESSRHNPVLMLGTISQERLHEVLKASLIPMLRIYFLSSLAAW